MKQQNFEHQASWDIFISYATKDGADIATGISQYLETNGVSCWIAPRNIRPGRDYASEIILGIKACRVFVLVLTEQANRSSHVANEVDRAFHYQKLIIPVKIEQQGKNLQLSTTLEYYLSKTHWINTTVKAIREPDHPRHPVKDLLAKCLEQVSVLNKDEPQHQNQSESHQPPKCFESAKEDETLIIKVVGNSSPPARIFKDGGVATGFYFDTINAIAARQNIRVQFICASFDMSFKMLKMGQAHVMIGPNKTPQREKEFIFSNIPLRPAKKVFYVSTRADPIIRYEDLYGCTLITMKNTFYSKEIATDTKLVRVEITNYKTGIEMVNDSNNASKGYVLIMPENQGDFLLEELQIDLVKSPFCIQGNSSFIIYSKQTPKPAITTIEEGLKNVMDDNTYDQILGMY